MEALAASSCIAMNRPRLSFPSTSFQHPLNHVSFKFAIFIASRTIPRTSFASITTRCSTKPNTNTNSSSSSNSEHDQNPVENDQLNPSTMSQASSGKSPPFSPASPSALSVLCSRGLVLDLGLEGSWDSADVGSPVVKRFLSDEEERWYMWYHGRSSMDPDGCSNSIGLAISNNGVHWERATKAPEYAGLVMRCSKDWWAFDTAGIRPCEVVVMSSSKVRAASAVYWLYYTGYSSEMVKYSENSLDFDLENPETGSLSRRGSIFMSLPGLAISQDSRHWARIEGDHHSGALFDVGADNEWDSLFVAGPRVVFHTNGDLRMYYHSFDKETGEFCIGMARSRDGIKWVKLGKVLGGRRGCLDECGTVNAHVVKDGKDGKYLMVYEGVDSNGDRSIGFAISNDGLKDWRRPSEEPMLKPSEEEGSWDNRRIGSPYLVQLEDQWRLYYRGVGSGGRSGIGMAVCEGSGIGRFHRWTGFHI